MRISISIFTSLICASVSLGAADTARAQEVERPLVSVVSSKGTYRVEGRFSVNAPPEIVFGVLTDYAHIPEFVKSVRSSRVQSSDGDRILVAQETTGTLLFFRKTLKVLLEVRVEKFHTIRFQDLLHADFVSYQGSWAIEDRGGVTDVVYQMTARPRMSLPQGLGQKTFESNVSSLLASVQREIQRRATRNVH